jgi:uracil-DNA glycosylase
MATNIKEDAATSPRYPAVFGELETGPSATKPKVSIMIGEQPGDSEDEEGRPFVGPAGRLLDQCLQEAGIDRRYVLCHEYGEARRTRSGNAGIREIELHPSAAHRRGENPMWMATVCRGFRKFSWITLLGSIE